ncbi:MAG: hypothetical protein KJ737_05005 [Proteobacteria bacterium]|nr:hypothetical protein [Pseudomonadota bacterium]
MMIAQAERIATTAFVGFDGYRGPLFFSCVPLIMFFMTLSPSVLHDTILSGCKFKSEFELELISRIAVPDAQVSIKESFPGVSVLSIRFD